MRKMRFEGEADALIKLLGKRKTVFISRCFDRKEDGVIAFFTCKRCGFRVISEEDAVYHYVECLKHPGG